MADQEHVEIRTYEIIYQVLEDIENAMLGLLAPEFEEVVTGEAEVREIFRVPRVGAIAGCYVLNGTITRNSKVRFLREGTIIWKGAINSLRRFKDDVREVQSGLRVRHRPHRLPGPQAGRHHRDLRGSRDPAGLTAVLGCGHPRPGPHRRSPHTPTRPSLKEKRSVITPILEGARRRHHVASAETGTQAAHTRAELGFVSIAGSSGHVTDVIDAVERFVWSFPEVEVVTSERNWLEVD